MNRENLIIGLEPSKSVTASFKFLKESPITTRMEIITTNVNRIQEHTILKLILKASSLLPLKSSKCKQLQSGKKSDGKASISQPQDDSNFDDEPKLKELECHGIVSKVEVEGSVQRLQVDINLRDPRSFSRTQAIPNTELFRFEKDLTY